MIASKSFRESLSLGLRGWWPIALGIVLLYALWMRIPHLSESLWLDELHSSWVVGGRWNELLARCRISNQALLYFALLKCWTVFGGSETALRLPSLFAGLTLICLIMWECWRGSQSRLAAVTVGLLAAADRRFVFYATEVRPYAFVQALAVLHALWTMRLVGSRSLRDRVLWIAIGAILFHLHYTSSLFIAAECLWLVVMAIRQTPSAPAQLKQRCADFVGLAFCAAPAFWHLGEIADRRHLWSAIAMTSNPLEVLTLFEAHSYLGGALAAAILLTLAAKLLGLKTSSPSEQDPKINGGAEMGAEDAWRPLSLLSRANLWLLLAILPVAAAWFATNTMIAPIFMSRYLIASAAGSLVLTGYLIGAVAPRHRAWVALAAVSLALAGAPNLDRFYAFGRSITDRQEDWRQAVTWTSQQAESTGYPVLVRPGLLEETMLAESGEKAAQDYLLFPLFGAYRFPSIKRQDCFSLTPKGPGLAMDSSAFELIQKRNGCLLLIRGRRRDADGITQRLKHRLLQQSLARKVTVTAGPRCGFVHLRRVRLE